MHRTLTQAKPSEEMILDFTKIFERYVGEVYRKFHPGEWGIIALKGEKGVGVYDIDTGCSLWPCDRLLTKGSS